MGCIKAFNSSKRKTSAKKKDDRVAAIVKAVTLHKATDPQNGKPIHSVRKIEHLTGINSRTFIRLSKGGKTVDRRSVTAGKPPILTDYEEREMVGWAAKRVVWNYSF